MIFLKDNLLLTFALQKSMERLSELLMDLRTARILGRSDSGNNLTWDLLFQSVHRLILKVTDFYHHDLLSNTFMAVIFVILRS